MPERRGREPDAAVERVRNAGRGENGLERRAPAVDRRHDERELLRRRAVAEQLEHVVGHELERAAGAGALEERDRAAERRRATARRLEEGALEPREGGSGELGGAR